MIKRIFVLLVLLNIVILPQTLLDVPKFRIYPGSMTQTEPVATVHPQNSSIIFASAVTINITNGFRSEGVYTSSDGGYTWMGNDTCTGPSIVNHGGDPGVVVSNNNRLILSHIGNLFPGMFTNYSDDMGETWSAAKTITSNLIEDKGTLAVDHSAQSTYQGRLYLAWVDYVNVSVQTSYSTDDGDSWTQPMQVNPTPPTRSTGSSIVTGTDGTVYLCWAGVTSNSSFVEDYIGFARSTDGGTSWNVNQNIIDMNGIAGLLAEKNNIRVNSIPQIEMDRSGGTRDGWLYIVTTEKNNSPAGTDPDIILHRSTDNGASWSQGIRVNQDPVNNGKIQYFPFLNVDESGNLDIIYYDDRNTTSDSAAVVIARSANGGDNWKDYAIKNSTFKPKPISGGTSGYQGDHIAILSNDTHLNAFWMADYSGVYQIWSSVIDLTLLGTIDGNSRPPEDFALYQNYPNPFNPSTVIRFSIPKESFVTLKIYNSLGQEVQTLVQSLQHSGDHEVSFKPRHLSSGVYFYTLRAGDFQDSRKMLLLK